MLACWAPYSSCIFAIIILNNFSESAHPSKNSGCFTGEAKVVVESGRIKNMSEVVLGDKIQAVDSTGKMVFSEVLMFMDREPTETRKFVTITTEDGAVLTLTSTHLVHTGAQDCEDLQASSATPCCCQTAGCGRETQHRE